MNRSFDRGPQNYREAPGRTWPDHSGAAAANAVYGVHADQRVGEVLTAWSNRTRDGFVPRPRKQIISLVIIGLIVGGMIVVFGGLTLEWFFGEVLELGFDDWLPFVIAGTFTGIGGWLVSRPRAGCTYVGTGGIAQHHDGIFRRTDDVLSFANAATLNIAETNRYTNGVYQGTDFRFTWKGANGKALFKGAGTRFIQGMFKDMDVPAWAFLCAAEVQWNQHRWGRAEAEWDQHQHATFGDLVVQEGALVINGETLSPSDLESISFQQGFMHVRKLGAKTGVFGTKGITTRAIAMIPDFPLFLRALRQWGGFQV